MPRLRDRATIAADAPRGACEEPVGPRRPTPLLGLPEDLPADAVVIVDTETSGFHTDDGATLSVVSLAWLDGAGEVVDRAYPFDQERSIEKGSSHTGREPGAKGAKKAGEGALSLFSDADLAETEDDPNLGEEEWRELLEWLSRRWLGFWNAKFDLHHLRNGTRHWPGIDLEPRFVWDGMLACGALWPGEGASLKPTAARLWGDDETEEQRALGPYLKGKRYDLVPWDVMRLYAAKDANQTLRLMVEQKQLVTGRKVGGGTHGRGLPRAEREGIEIAHRLEHVLYRVERRGMPYDAEQSQAAAVAVEMAAREPARRLEALWGTVSADAARDWFYSHGASLVYDPRKGEYTRPVDIVVTRDWIRDGIPGAEDWRRYVQLNQANSMYYQGYADMTGRDGCLRTDFKLASVRSGRMSVGRVQLQAIPKMDKAVGLEGVPHVRELFFTGPGARPGYRAYNLDLSQAELRVATQLSGCTKMRDMLEGGADLHSITTEAVFGMRKGETDPAEFKQYRDIAKRLTFGSIFQVGGKTFQATLKKLADVDWPLDRCEAAIQGWRRTYPEFSRAWYRAKEFVEAHRYVELVSGRKSWMNGPRDYPQAGWNRTVQASLADFVVRWLHDVEEATRAYDGLVMTVHDSAVLYLPEDVGPELAHQIAVAGADKATEEFGITMRIDEGLWFE